MNEAYPSYWQVFSVLHLTFFRNNKFNCYAIFNYVAH